VSGKKIIRNQKKVLVVGDSFAYKDNINSHWVDLLLEPIDIEVDHLSVPGGNTALIIGSFWDKINENISKYQCLFYFPTSLLRHSQFGRRKVDDTALDIINRLHAYVNAPDEMLDYYLYGDTEYKKTDHCKSNSDVFRVINSCNITTHGDDRNITTDYLDEIEQTMYCKTPIWYNTQLSMLAIRSLFLKAKQHDILTINNVHISWLNECKDIQKHIPEIDINWVVDGNFLAEPDNLKSKNHYSLATASKIKQEFIKNINAQGYQLL